MARIYRQSSKIKKDGRKKLRSSILMILTAVISCFLFIYNIERINTYIIGLFIIVMSILMVFTIKEIRQYKIIKAGVTGEKKTLKILKKLPKDYNILNNVFLQSNSKRSEIDLMVIGKNGIFVIEVKNNRGLIKGNANETILKQTKKSKKGYYYDNDFKNPKNQLYREVNVAHDFLKERGINKYVQGIIFFSNDEVRLNIENMPDNMIDDEEKLIRYIKSYRTSYRLNDNYMKEIIDCIKAS